MIARRRIRGKATSANHEYAAPPPRLPPPTARTISSASPSRRVTPDSSARGITAPLWAIAIAFCVTPISAR